MSKRVVTSAIPDMSVGEVRRNLDVVRKRWNEASTHRPFYLTDTLSDTNSMTLQQFALKFVIGHHFKRHNQKKE